MQVVLLENTGNPEIFVSKDIPSDARIPLTQVQKDLGMIPDLSGKIPFVEDALKAGKEVVLGKICFNYTHNANSSTELINSQMKFVNFTTYLIISYLLSLFIFVFLNL